jgi:hypothetical protein
MSDCQSPQNNEGKKPTTITSSSTCTNDNKSNSFNNQFPPLCYTHPPPSSPVAPPYVNLNKTDRRVQHFFPSNKSPSSSDNKHYFNHEKQMYGDQHIKVLTPSEIMKSLPDLSQDECGYNSSRMVRNFGTNFRNRV